MYVVLNEIFYAIEHFLVAGCEIPRVVRVYRAIRVWLRLKNLVVAYVQVNKLTVIFDYVQELTPLHQRKF